MHNGTYFLSGGSIFSYTAETAQRSVDDIIREKTEVCQTAYLQLKKLIEEKGGLKSLTDYYKNILKPQIIPTELAAKVLGVTKNEYLAAQQKFEIRLGSCFLGIDESKVKTFISEQNLNAARLC